MTQRRALPRICIALGLPDIPRLLEQARRKPNRAKTSSNSVSTTCPILLRAPRPSQIFLEQYRTAPCSPPAADTRTTANSMAASRSSCGFWNWRSTTGRARSRRRNRNGRSHPERCAELRTPRSSDRFLASFRNHAAARSGHEADARRFRPTYTRLVSTARKPTDTGADSRRQPAEPEDSAGHSCDGRDRLSLARALHGLRFGFYLCGARSRPGHGRRTGQCTAAAIPLPNRQVHARRRRFTA